jgi:hypothetical protein
MTKDDYDRMVELNDTIQSALAELEQLIKDESPREYERWKAGGKHVTNEFVSMYPSLEEVIESLEYRTDEYEDDAEDTDNDSWNDSWIVHDPD